MKKLTFISSDAPQAKKAAEKLIAAYGQCQLANSDVIVALGGDGFMLHTLHANMNSGRQIYGMNRGSVGFLMNAFKADHLIERIEKATSEVNPAAGNGRGQH